ncbi:MAG: hypothetical protein WCO06_05085 [Candidatus Roizmanbacteria bacterium]
MTNIKETPQSHSLEIGTYAWLMRETFLNTLRLTEHRKNALVNPDGYEPIVHNLLKQLSTPSTVREQASRVQLLLNLNTEAESIHPLRDNFLAHLESAHSPLDTIINRIISSKIKLRPNEIDVLEKMGYTYILQGLLERQNALLGDDSLSSNCILGTEVKDALKKQFARYVDRALSDTDQAHGYHFNTSKQGLYTAQLLAHSPCFYQKVAKLVTLFYAYESNEFPVRLFSEPQLNQMIASFNSRGDEGLRELWDDYQFLHDTYKYLLHSQSTGVGRSKQLIERIHQKINLLKHKGVWKLEVFGSGLVQTQEIVQVLTQKGIKVRGVGFDKLDPNTLRKNTRVFTYPDGAGAPGKELSSEEIKKVLRLHPDHEQIVLDIGVDTTTIHTTIHTDYGEYELMDPRIIGFTSYDDNSLEGDSYISPIGFDDERYASLGLFPTIRVATNSIVPHLDGLTQLHAIYAMLKGNNQTIIIIGGNYYPIQRIVLELGGIIQRRDDGLIAIVPHHLVYSDGWTTQANRHEIGRDDFDKLRLPHPAQQRDFFYPERLSTNLTRFL